MNEWTRIGEGGEGMVEEGGTKDGEGDKAGGNSQNIH